MDSLFGTKPYMAPICTMSSTGLKTSAKNSDSYYSSPSPSPMSMDDDDEDRVSRTSNIS